MIVRSSSTFTHKTIQRFIATSITSRTPTQAEYDLIVIGGGSGGLSCSKTASDLGAKVALIDAVEPTPSGVSWGIGGTCANVGCIPKKLMHQAAIVGKEIRNAAKYGWRGIGEISHDWESLAKVVNDRIKANNWIYRVQLNEKKVKYYNGFARFEDRNTIIATGVTGKRITTTLKAPKIVISTGLRPRYPRIEGAELGITSDDLFTLRSAPGKTLVVGAGYVALECAGLLTDLGQNVELLIRSRPLKGFDKDCVDKVVSNLESHGVKTRWMEEVASVREENGKKLVQFTGNSGTDTYDTVIWAMGRDPVLSSLRLDTVKVSTSVKTGKILADEYDRTSVDGIFAVGDVVQNRDELTPLAIQSGQLLAKRIFSKSTDIVEYEKTATTVFTPLELSTVGLTEEEAKREYEEDELEIYHSYFTPFEFVVPQNRDSENCYVKLICNRKTPRNVLGMHFVGPNAAEVMQGFAVAFRKGITFDDIKSTIAIHPCSAEEFVKLSITKRSGLDPKVTGCCG